MKTNMKMKMKRTCDRERGIALISSLLLLLVLTIIALSMFRSFSTQEHIAGNLREKERALHAAESAQQYAEWWLNQAGNTATGAVSCAPGAPLIAAQGQGQICNQTPQQAGLILPNVPVSIPWPVQTTYVPPGMSVTPGVPGANGDPPYALAPGFYITDIGVAGDNQGEAYQIDAYGSGSTAAGAASATVAVVESTYEIQRGVTCLSCGP
jgi:type IV pilus assembly protein PilX